jgi:hypothetical protein
MSNPEEVSSLPVPTSKLISSNDDEANLCREGRKDEETVPLASRRFDHCHKLLIALTEQNIESEGRLRMTSA